MSRRKFRCLVALVAVWFIALTITIFVSDVTGDLSVKLKTAMPLLIGLPTAGLAEAFRRRQMFKSNLLNVYSRALSDFQCAMRYTLLANPTVAEFNEAQSAISGSIDHVRTLFANITATGTKNGLYPFEAIKTMLDWIEWLDYGPSWKGEAAAKKARQSIAKLWRDHLRSPLLNELDPKPPATRMSPYITNDRRVVSRISHDDWPVPERPRDIHQWPK